MKIIVILLQVLTGFTCIYPGLSAWCPPSSLRWCPSQGTHWAVLSQFLNLSGCPAKNGFCITLTWKGLRCNPLPYLKNGRLIVFSQVVGKYISVHQGTTTLAQNVQTLLQELNFNPGHVMLLHLLHLVLHHSVQLWLKLQRLQVVHVPEIRTHQNSAKKDSVRACCSRRGISGGRICWLPGCHGCSSPRPRHTCVRQSV